MFNAKMMGPREFKVTYDAPEPVLKNAEEALIVVGGSGICGSDMHPYLGESIRATYDRTPGHEFTGTIEAINTSRPDLKPGDKVAINPAVACGECYLCKDGLGYICENCEVIGGEREGAFCEKIIVPVSTLYKLPDDIDLAQAAIIEPMAFAEHCSQGLDNETVVVIGQGAIGLSCSLVLLHKGCTVIALDISDSQLKTAKELGCQYVINSRTEDPVAKIKEIVGEKRVKYVLDTVFNKWSIKFNMDILQKGGTMVMVGVPVEKDFSFDVLTFLCRELNIRTRYLYTSEDFEAAVSYVVDKKINYKPLISKVFPLTEIEKAFEYKASTPSFKVVLKNGG